MSTLLRKCYIVAVVSVTVYVSTHSLRSLCLLFFNESIENTVSARRVGWLTPGCPTSIAPARIKSPLLGLEKTNSWTRPLDLWLGKISGTK